MVHPNKYVIVLLWLLSSVFMFSQTFEISGRVSIHNSKVENGKIEYVENVEIYAPNAEVAVSDYKGRFQLNVKGLNKNDVINVIAKKKGWEVANKVELDNVELGETSSLRIFLVKKEKLDAAQAVLLESSLSSFLTLKDTLFFNLEVNSFDGEIVKQELEKRLGVEFSNREEAKNFLNQISKDVEKSLPEFSKELAAVNLDFASDMYRTAFEHYQNGAIENAIVTIDENELDTSLENILLLLNNTKEANALKKVKRVRAIQLAQIKESYQLKSKCLQQVFRFQDANRLNNKIEYMELALREEGIKNKVKMEEKLQADVKEYSEEITLTNLEAKDSIAVQTDSIDVIATDEILDSTSIATTDELLPKGNPKASTILELNDKKLSPDNELKTVVTALLVKEKSNASYLPEYEKEEVKTIITTEPQVVEKNETVVIETPKELITTSSPEITIEQSEPITYVAPQSELLVFSDVVEPSLPKFSITKKTSLRRGPSSKTKVLKRLNVGTKVEVLEKINRYWCRVLLNGKEGYVKALLLKEVR